MHRSSSRIDAAARLDDRLGAGVGGAASSLPISPQAAPSEEGLIAAMIFRENKQDGRIYHPITRSRMTLGRPMKRSQWGSHSSERIELCDFAYRDKYAVREHPCISIRAILHSSIRNMPPDSSRSRIQNCGALRLDPGSLPLIARPCLRALTSPICPF